MKHKVHISRTATTLSESHLYLISFTLNTTFRSCIHALPFLLLSHTSPPPLAAPPSLFITPFSFLLSFYLPPRLALSWRPVVKCKHDWAPEPEGFDSYQLFLCSRPSSHAPPADTAEVHSLHFTEWGVSRWKRGTSAFPRNKQQRKFRKDPSRVGSIPLPSWNPWLQHVFQL